MKHLKKLLALALVLLTALTLAAPAALADELPSKVIGEIGSGAAYFFNKPDGDTKNTVAGRQALGEGVVVYVLARNGIYFKVQTQDDNKVGYVKSMYVTIINMGYIPTESANNPIGGTSTGTTAPTTGTQTTTSTDASVTLPQGAIGKGVTKEKVILRKTADKSTASSNRVMGDEMIPTGAEVYIYAQSGSFYEISYKDYRGYARSEDITVTAAVQNGQLVTATGGGNAGRDIQGTSTPVSSDAVAVPSGLSLSSDETKKWQATNQSYAAAKSKNNDTIGWIYVPGTNINYPIMYSTTFYYNDHTPEKKSAVQGSIYSYTSGVAPITILFGHNSRSSKTMFHQLHHVQACLLGKSKCEKCGASVSGCNRTTFNITIGNYHTWELFAFYETPHGVDTKTFSYNTTSYALTGANKQSYIDFQLQQAKASSLGKALGTATSNDPIICLVVCGDKYYKVSNARLYMFLKAVG